MRNFKFFMCILLIFLFVFTFTFPCFAENTTYVWSPMTNSTITNNTVNSDSTQNQTTETNSNSTGENSLSLECGSAILIEQTTGQILYEHNIHEKLRPASVTKVMSILLIMEALDSRKNQFNR